MIIDQCSLTVINDGKHPKDSGDGNSSSEGWGYRRNAM
jgi:hypothetical protein